MICWVGMGKEVMRPMFGLAGSVNLGVRFGRKREEELCLFTAQNQSTHPVGREAGQSYRELHLFLDDSEHPASTWTDFPTEKPFH
jgi:hypothetical protein